MAAPVVAASFSPVTPVAPATATVAGGAAFHSVFSSAVAKVELFQQNAEDRVERFLAGEGDELHRVALDAQRAEISFELFMQVRNKVVAAYQEIMRMQV